MHTYELIYTYNSGISPDLLRFFSASHRFNGDQRDLWEIPQDMTTDFSILFKVNVKSLTSAPRYLLLIPLPQPFHVGTWKGGGVSMRKTPHFFD